MNCIDGHLHVDWGDFRLKNLVDYINTSSLDAAVLLTWEESNPSIPSLYKHLSLESILEAKSSLGDRVIPFYAPDPMDPLWHEKLEKAKQSGIKGCGELKVSIDWNHPSLPEYLSYLEENRFPLLCHMEKPRRHFIIDKTSIFNKALDTVFNNYKNGVSRFYLQKFINNTGISKNWLNAHLVDFSGYLQSFGHLENILLSYPRLNIIGHGPHFWNNLSIYQNERLTYQKGPYSSFGIIDRLLEQYPNLFCDISGYSGYFALSRDRNMSRIFVQKHYKKIIYGTDNVFLDQKEIICSLLTGQSEQKNVLYNNILSLI